MTCHHFNINNSIINHLHGEIEEYKDENGIWMEHSEKTRLLKQMLSKKISAPKVQRKQLPSISPTSEAMLSELGTDYGTYFAYKSAGSYARNLIENR